VGIAPAQTPLRLVYTVESMRPSARRAMGIALALAALAALPHVLGGLSRTFVNFDDNDYVYENQVVLRGLTSAGARWALTTFHASNWHPLTWLSHQLDVELFGTRAWGHHLTSVVLHGVNAALLFAALARLTGAVWRSAIVAALFGVHPLHVESVAWVAERKDVLSGLCFMLVLLAYERFVRRRGPWRYLLVAGLFAVGLTAKPMLVTLPPVLLLLDFWPLGRIAGSRSRGGGLSAWRSVFLEKVPLLALSGASVVVTLLAQRTGGAVKDAAFLTLTTRLANAAVAYTGYLGKAVWPASLSFYYPYPLAGHPPWKVGLALLLLAAATGAALGAMRRRPAPAVGLFWFLGMLVPVIGLIQVGGQAMADRYTYLPLVGLFVAGTWASADLVARGRFRVAALGGIAALAVGLLTATAAVQVGAWRDAATLYARALAATSENWVVHTNLGVVLAGAGRHEEAIGHYREALRIQPGFAVAHNDLGVSLAALGRHAEAIGHYREALRIRADFAEAWDNLGSSQSAFGSTGDAIAAYREALRIRPDFAKARYNLGVALGRAGRLDDALAAYREALRIRPDFADAHFNAGIALVELGRGAEAVAHFRGVLNIHPGDAEAWNNLGIALNASGRREEGLAALREARRLRAAAAPKP
jgi:Flp pilus assembly protein TadD